jgi:ABC-type proline/glycine betaine transport system substrate-binding protein
MGSRNFSDWRIHISGRMKLKQILESFAGKLTPEIKKYVCAPCSNCKGQIRDIIKAYGLSEKYGVHYGGLAELMVNSMTDIKRPFIDWESS